MSPSVERSVGASVDTPAEIEDAPTRGGPAPAEASSGPAAAPTGDDVGAGSTSSHPRGRPPTSRAAGAGVTDLEPTPWATARGATRAPASPGTSSILLKRK
jgi:hypothetical protein